MQRGLEFSSTFQADQERLRHARCQAVSSGRIVDLMRTQSIPERHRPFLVLPVIGAPVVVHGPGIKCLCGFNGFSPYLRVGLRADKVGGDPTNFHKRGIQGEPGDAVILI